MSIRQLKFIWRNRIPDCCVPGREITFWISTRKAQFHKAQGVRVTQSYNELRASTVNTVPAAYLPRSYLLSIFWFRCSNRILPRTSNLWHLWFTYASKTFYAIIDSRLRILIHFSRSIYQTRLSKFFLFFVFVLKTLIFHDVKVIFVSFDSDLNEMIINIRVWSNNGLSSLFMNYCRS